MKFITMLVLVWLIKAILYISQVIALVVMCIGAYYCRLEMVVASIAAVLIGSGCISKANEAIKFIKNQYKNPPPTRSDYDKALRRAAVEWNMRNGIHRKETNETIPG